jgi:hypothetical protein
MNVIWSEICSTSSVFCDEKKIVLSSSAIP